MKIPGKSKIMGAIPAMLIFIILSLVGCDEDNSTGPGTTPRLVVSPDTLYLADSSAEGQLFMSTDAPGKLDWVVTTKPAWVTVSPSEGEIGQSIESINVTADTTGMDIGSHHGRMEIISTGGKCHVCVVCDVSTHPVAEVRESELDFGDTATSMDLWIHSTGNGILHWQIDIADQWCIANTVQGSTWPGDSAKIRLTVNRGSLDPGNFNTTMTITSNSSGDPITLSINMEVLARAILVYSDTLISFGFLQDTAAIEIQNQGNIGDSYDISFDETYVSSSQSNVTIGRDESVEIEIYLDRSQIPSDTLPFEASLILSNNDFEDAIPINIYNYSPDLWDLEINIIDAEYCREINKIVAVSANPAKFHIIDPAAETIQSIDLGSTPNCVAIRFDGLYAVVGHDALVTYIDMTTLQIVNTWSVSIDVLDIILPSNGWAYAFPRADQWSKVMCVELSTGLQVPHKGLSIYAGTKAKLHPSEEYIYGADNGLSPSDFEKYDIRTDTMVYLYDSPYHGDYSFSGNLWISDDGARIFARSSNVFTSSSSREDDMLYAGNLAGINSVIWADQSTAAGKVYVLGTTGNWWEETYTGLYIYETQYLAFQGKASLPKVLIPVDTENAILYDAEGYYVFADSAGEYWYVLAKAEEASGQVNNWFLISLATDENP